MTPLEDGELLGPEALQRGGVWQCLHWLAAGRTTPEALAKALAYWIDQPKQNIASEVAEYDWDNVAKKQLEVYA